MTRARHVEVHHLGDVANLLRVGPQVEVVDMRRALAAAVVR